MTVGILTFTPAVCHALSILKRRTGNSFVNQEAACLRQRRRYRCSLPQTRSNAVVSCVAAGPTDFDGSRKEFDDLARQAIEAGSIGDESERFPSWGEPTEEEMQQMETWGSDTAFNCIILTGRLGADPELRTVGDGIALCKFALAVTNEYDPLSGTGTEGTSWFDVQAWGNTAKYIASQGRKGLRVGITGTFGINSWVGRDGVQRNDPSVTAETFEVLQSRSESSGSTRTNANSTKGTFSDNNTGYRKSVRAEEDFSDLPF